jgi:ABC-type uncharacterized transport system auxiliary subunit
MKRYQTHPYPRTRPMSDGAPAFTTVTGTKTKSQKQSPKDAAKKINSRIMSCVKNGDGDWAKVLELHQSQREAFNAINYSTAMNRLAKMKNVRRQDPRMESFLNGVTLHLQAHPMEWTVRNKVTVLHSVAKMRLDLPAAQKLVRLILQDAGLIVEAGSPQTISMTAWASATMGIASPHLFKAIDRNPDCVVAPHASPQAIANTAWAFATLKADGTAFFRAVENHTSRLVQQGIPQHIAMTAWAFATMGIASPQLFKAIDKDPTCVIAPHSTPQAIANTAWASATLGIACPQLFKAIDRNHDCVVTQGDSQAIANTAWAFATLQADGTAFFRAVENHISLLVQQGTPQAIANTAWAFAKMGIASPQLFKAIDRDPTCVIAPHSSPQVIANTAWASATLGIACPQLFKAIDKDPTCVVTQGDSQAIANTAWAFATMGIASSRLFKAIEKDPASVIAHGTAQHIANTAWSFATLKANGTAFFQAIDDSASRLVQQGTTQNIANTVWAFASRDIQAPSLCLRVEEHAAFLVSRGDYQGISSIIWSFATLGVVCPKLCRAINKDTSRLIHEGDSQYIANTLWAMSILGVDAPELIDAIKGPVAENCVRLGTNHNILNICYALAISDSFPRHIDTFTKFWNKANEVDWNELAASARAQLVQSYLIASCVHGVRLSPPKWLSAPLRADVHKSKSHLEMSSILNDLDFHHDNEVSPLGSDNASNFWSIDCACRDRKIAIEFDGPFHFLRLAGSRDHGKIENGPTKAKRRFLKSLGWKVINISHFEWQETRTREGRQNLLEKRLKSIF